MTSSKEKVNPNACKPEVDQKEVSLKNETSKKIPHIRALVKVPGVSPYARLIENTLKNLQRLVGGYIETVDLDNNVVLVCDEDGKCIDLPFNFYLYSDYVVGTAVFVSRRGEHFGSLNEEQIDYVKDLIKERN